MFIGIILFLSFCFLLTVKYHWNRKRLYTFAWKLNGPFPFPVIGNGLEFNCKNEDLYDIFNDLINRYKHPMSIWVGPKLFSVFTDLSHVEKIFNSTKLAYKSEVYKFMGYFGRAGLVQNSGPEWKAHRKLIMPTMNQRYAMRNLAAVNRHCAKLWPNLKTDQMMDVSGTFHRYWFDVTGEILFGFDVGTQEGRHLNVIHSFHRLYELIFCRMVKPWLHLDFTYKMTKAGTEAAECKKWIRDFADKIIENSTSRIRQDPKGACYVIDLMLKADEKEQQFVDRATIIDHVMTLYTACDDTFTLITSAACLCFGMYPEYQAIAAEEIRIVFGEEPREFTIEDLSKLTYLEMCLKDVLRLFPIAPLVAREAIDDVKVDDFTIPVGCQVLVPIDILHKRPDQWERPTDFYPDHFLPEAARKRHACNYVPFSMGPRSCAGVQLVMPFLKGFMANFLQRYELEATGKYADLKFTSYISLRARDGYNVRMKNRSWH